MVACIAEVAAGAQAPRDCVRIQYGLAHRFGPVIPSPVPGTASDLEHNCALYQGRVSVTEL